MIRGDEKRVWITATMDEKISPKAVRLSVFGLKGSPVPLQAFDAQSVMLLRSAKPGDKLRLKVWEWAAERAGLV